MSKNYYKNTYRVFVSGMIEGRCKRASQWFDVGARSEKEALSILKKEYNKTLKYSVVFQHKSDLGIPMGHYIKRG